MPMDNIYFNRIHKLLVKNQTKIQDLQKQKLFLEKNQIDSFKIKNLDLVLDKKASKLKDTSDKIENINRDIKDLDKLINNLQSLEVFSKSIDDLKIVSYVDGHLDEVENKLFEKIIEIDIKLKKDIELMKTANSFFGEFEDDIEYLDPSILENWIQLEETAKKNALSLAKPKFKTKNIITKIRDFITFKPMDFGLAAVASMVLGIGFIYGVNKTIIASNPALIQLAQLSTEDTYVYNRNISDTFPGSRIMEPRGDKKQKTKSIFKCFLPNINLDPKLFNSYFNIKVTNPKTNKSFNFSDKDKILAGNKIEFYFNYNKKGTLYIDNVITSNKLSLEKINKKSSCKTSNFLTLNYNSKINTKIGDTYSISSPWQKEKIIISFKETNNSEKKAIGILNYQPTTLENFDNKFFNIKWNKQPDVEMLKSNDLFKLHSKIFKKSLYTPRIKSWKNKLKINGVLDKIFIDFDSDNKAEIVAYKNEKDNIEYYVFDTNNDAKGDVLVYPKIIDKIINYEWLIDTNYDGKIDQIAEDTNGDWKIDKTKDM